MVGTLPTATDEDVAGEELKLGLETLISGNDGKRISDPAAWAHHEK